MKLRHILLVFALATGGGVYGQSQQDYAKHISEADAHYNNKDYRKSAEAYSKAFAALGGKGYMNDRYNAACVWSLAGVPDSAFSQLFRIAEKMNFSDLGHLSVDTDLEPLKKDKRWNEVYNLVKQNKEKAEANLDKDLVAMLDEIYAEDQKYRMQIDKTEREHGRKSKQMEQLFATMQRTDSLNLIKVRSILDKRGWLGPDVVGARGNNTLFLVIQHADHKTQLKYLPMMREAVTKGKAQGSALALLEDRVALGEGKRQIYGSQIAGKEEGGYYVRPLEDPDNVDKRRASVGLDPLADYVRFWNMTWNLEQYKKELPELEAMERKRFGKQTND